MLEEERMTVALQRNKSLNEEKEQKDVKPEEAR